MVRKPTEAAVAVCLGIAPHLDFDNVCDVAVVGAAGLATCVCAASEGLSVLAFD